jgi:hypothetical protein
LLVQPDASLQLYTAYTGAVIDPYDGGLFTFAMHIATQEEHVIKIFPSIGSALYIGTVHNISNTVQFSGVFDTFLYRYAFLAMSQGQQVVVICSFNPRFSYKIIIVPVFLTSVAGLSYNVDAGTLAFTAFDNMRGENVIALIEPTDFSLLLLDRVTGYSTVMFNTAGIRRPLNYYAFVENQARVREVRARTSRTFVRSHAATVCHSAVLLLRDCAHLCSQSVALLESHRHTAPWPAGCVCAWLDRSLAPALTSTLSASAHRR